MLTIYLKQTVQIKTMPGVFIRKYNSNTTSNATKKVCEVLTLPNCFTLGGPTTSLIWSSIRMLTCWGLTILLYVGKYILRHYLRTFFLFKPICIPIWTYKFQQILYSRPLKVGEIKDCKFCRKLKTVRTRMTYPPRLKKKRTESPSHDLMNMMTRYITEEIQKNHFAQGKGIQRNRNKLWTANNETLGLILSKITSVTLFSDH
jgi:hypothetical protein